MSGLAHSDHPRCRRGHRGILSATLRVCSEGCHRASARTCRRPSLGQGLRPFLVAVGRQCLAGGKRGRGRDAILTRELAQVYDRREFLFASGQLVSAVMVGGVSAAEAANDLAYSPASELLARFRERKLSPMEVLEVQIERIETSTIKSTALPTSITMRRARPPANRRGATGKASHGLWKGSLSP